ncbi:ABC transporter ATP-binding protein [Actinomadura luteofluorescens]|uniref:ABC transporter ATP-binding protein n=1 Tax=Actinomadura luteofluorescens TaxID=46163 RepID=UPI0030D4F79C
MADERRGPAAADGASLLAVEDLHVSFDTDDGTVRAVRGVSFTAEQGRTLAIVGESGSGKSVATQTVTGLTRGAAARGSIVFKGTQLLGARERELRAIRGAQIGMVFQDHISSLHPYHRVGAQIVEAIRAHDRSVSREDARRRAVELLTRVGVPAAGGRLRDYPHMFSGGMRQRVLLAMAMARDPALLIVDEPTTALDATVQAQVLDVLRRLCEEQGTGIIMITHDLGVVAEVADDVVVMYAGRVVERAPRRTLFRGHRHPYTEALLDSLPERGRGSRRLPAIRGNPPSPLAVPAGCAFAPRCPTAADRCRTAVPPLLPVDGDASHHTACWLVHESEEPQGGNGADDG